MKLNKYKYYAGRLSASSLGFIHGNLKGAALADKIFTSKYSMAPTPHKRGRSTTPRASSTIRGSSTNSRASKQSRIASRSRSRTRSRSSVSFGGPGITESTSVRSAVGKRTGGKKLKPKGRKYVKVSKDFKAKVMKATEAGKVAGQFHSTDIGVLTAALSGQQTTSHQLMPNSSGLNGLFNAKRVLHCVSRMWNGKAVTSTPQIADAGMIQPLQTVIDVKKQWWVYKIRNNSARTICVRMWKCAPKHLQSDVDPIGAWRQSITRAITEGYYITSPATYNDQLLYVKPQLFAQFNQFYKVEEVTMVIEPGQSHEFTITGPSMVYDMKKFYIDNLYQEYQKQDVILLSAVWTDLIGETAGVLVGRDGLNVGDGEVIYESQYFCNVVMPETIGWQSGGVMPAAGPVLNANRTKRYVFDQFERVTDLPGAEDRTDVIKNTD